MNAPRLKLPAATVLVALFAVIPIFWVTYIPANDYPFHLARIAILSMGEPSGLLGRYYQFGSGLLPNMALDAIALPLTTLVSPEMAVKLFLALMQLAFLGGCVVLHAAAFRRLSAWPLLCGLLLYNGIFLYGFFNYLLAAALALWGAALWLWSGPGWRRRLATWVVAVLLMWAHMGGFAVYALLIGAFEWHASRAGFYKEKWPVALMQLALAATPFVASVVLFLVFSPGSQRAGDGLTYAGWWGAKPLGALFSLQSGVWWADVLTLLALGALLLVLLLGRQVVVSGLVLGAAALLWLAFVVLPPEMLGSSFADVRLVPLAALASLLALAPREGQCRWAENLVLLVALGVGGVKTGALLAAWTAHQHALAGPVEAMRKLPGGATLFAATAAPYPTLLLTTPQARASWQPPLKHVASYASVYGAVFVPMTFADPHKQPMVMLPAYLPVKALQGDNPFKVPQPADLVALAQHLQQHARAPASPALGEVYVLVMGTHLYASVPALDGFKVFFAGSDFVIYQQDLNPTPTQAQTAPGDANG